MTDDKIPKWICLLEISGIFLIIASAFILVFPLMGIQNDINDKEISLSIILCDLTLSNNCRDRVIMADCTKAIIKNFPESAERNESLDFFEEAKDVSLNRWAQALLGGLGKDTNFTLSDFKKLDINEKINKTKELTILLIEKYNRVDAEKKLDERYRNGLIIFSTILQVFGLVFIESKRIYECCKRLRVK
ncbi:MAG: hypothetical protein KAT65_30410 [Methanophagales archaeon]|nr:hypothetical protein [Methanophagales archaeon]